MMFPFKVFSRVAGIRVFSRLYLFASRVAGAGITPSSVVALTFTLADHANRLMNPI